MCSIPETLVRVELKAGPLQQQRVYDKAGLKEWRFQVLMVVKGRLVNIRMKIIYDPLDLKGKGREMGKQHLIIYFKG